MSDQVPTREETSEPIPTREEFLAQPEIRALLDRRPEIKAFLDRHPYIILGRAAYEAESQAADERLERSTFEYESKPFPEMVLIQMYQWSTDKDLHNRRLFAAALINDEFAEEHFQTHARGPKDANQYDDPDGCLIERWKGK